MENLDYPQDIVLRLGDTNNICPDCGNSFIGHPLRVKCAKCINK